MSTENQPVETRATRRVLLKNITRCAVGAILGGGAWALMRRAEPVGGWTLDPHACTTCDGCATQCVKPLSAVKCVNDFDRCGYCEVCYGYFKGGKQAVPVDVPENRICPTDAIRRRRVGEFQWEYTIDEARCNGCGLCVKPCRAYGHASFRLRIRTDHCLNCSRCQISDHCPAHAIAWHPPGTVPNHA